jgi:hypothetical protein
MRAARQRQGKLPPTLNTGRAQEQGLTKSRHARLGCQVGGQCAGLLVEIVHEPASCVRGCWVGSRWGKAARFSGQGRLLFDSTRKYQNSMDGQLQPPSILA